LFNVHTRVSGTKQYKLVLVKGRWCLNWAGNRIGQISLVISLWAQRPVQGISAQPMLRKRAWST